MEDTAKVWILDDEGLNHEKEIKMYKQHNIGYKITTKDTFEKDLDNYGKLADAIVAQVGFQCPAELINKLEQCKIICTFGMGFNNVDLEAAKARNIYVCNIPDYCAEEVSDHTLALSLSMLRKLFTYNKKVKGGIWNPTDSEPIHRLSHTIVGLLGFGQIARKVANRFEAFGVKLIAHDKFVDEDVFKQFGVTSVSLDELLEQSNLLSLHVPLTKETKNLLDEERMRKLPKGAIIINTCRGGIIDEEALATLIKEKHLSGAGLDVLLQEPPKKSNELLQLEEAIITPHAAYYSVEAEEQMQTETALNVIRVIQNEQPKNIVNSL
ncbi:C-terminal binding protein [Pseudogracilibacillus sp. SO30301A]|uniref:C-terminal binding protein n=1 Tax=Pseudogracilibacillus sp. SO30301A TaxID=3098291 RepID=UPI00300E284D